MKPFLAVAMFALLASGSVAANTRQTYHPVPGPGPGATANPNLSDDDVRSQVRAYLGSIDTPIGAARWKVLGPRAEAPLLEVVRGEQLPTRRAKAIDGLSAVGTSQTELLRSIANNEQEPFVVRYASLRALGNLLPEKTMIAQLSPVMKTAKDLRIRAAAGMVLAQHAPKSTCGSVRAQIAHEAPASRDQFGRAMDACFAQ